MLTLANQMTIARMMFIPLLITLLLSNQHGWAFLVFVTAGVTDGLDGLIARRFRQSSSIGAFLDPTADKLLMTACFIILALPDHPKMAPDFEIANHLPLYLTIVTISRDVFIVMIALMIHLAQGFTQFHPTTLGKMTTVTQILMIGVVLLFNWLRQETPILVGALVWVTLAMTLASGVHYILHAARMAGGDGGDRRAAGG